MLVGNLYQRNAQPVGGVPLSRGGDGDVGQRIGGTLALFRKCLRGKGLRKGLTPGMGLVQVSAQKIGTG